MSSEKLQPAAELDNYHQQLSGVGFRQIESCISYLKRHCHAAAAAVRQASGR